MVIFHSHVKLPVSITHNFNQWIIPHQQFRGTTLKTHFAYCCFVSIQSFTHGLSILFQRYIPGDLYMAPNHPSQTILAYFSIKTCLNQHQVFNQPPFSRWNHHVLVVSTNHSEKWWSSSVGTVGMMNFPIWWDSHKIPWFQSPIS